DDAGRLAAEARIVLLREGCGRLLSELGQLGAAVEPRPGCRASASASTPGAGGTFARLEVIQLAERHKAAAGAPGIDHDDLFGRPIARDVRLAAGTPRLPRRVGCRHRAPHFPDATFRRLHVLTVAIHVAAVLELDGVQVARAGI